MNVALRPFTLAKRHALTISRGTSAGSENLLVTVTHEGIEGIGEMAPTGGGAKTENAATATEALERWIPLLHDVAPDEMQRVEAVLGPHEGDSAARAALDMALYDWQGKRLGVPVWRLFGLDRAAIVPTSLTVGINPPDVVRANVPEILARTGAKALKVKLGSSDGMEADKAIFAAAQEAATGFPGLSWRVDANGGWNVPQAIAMIAWLAARGVSYVEQPLARGQESDLQAVHHACPLPIYVDESVYAARDIPPLAAHVDGVNLKLMKCGGLREALRIIHVCRAHGLRVMMGCMSESSLAITAAAHLSPLADDLDLDSHLNLRPDPYAGAAWHEGRVLPTDAPGLGVTLREDTPKLEVSKLDA